MINPFITKAHVLRKYNTHSNSLYRNNYYNSLTSIYSFPCEDEGGSKEIINIEPAGCILEKLLQDQYYYWPNHDLIKTVEHILRGIVEYGKVYLEIHKESIHEESGKELLYSVKLKPIYGEIKWKTKDSYIIYAHNYALKQAVKHIVKKECLIVFDLKDLGLKRRTFNGLLRKIDKYDITKGATKLLEEVPEYDFTHHMNYADLQLLKKTREIGWAFNVNTLTDSQILYRKIKQDKLKLKMLDYIIDKLNAGLIKCCCQDVCTDEFGKIVTNVKRVNYDSLWLKYAKGELSTEQLSNVIYNNM